MQAGIEAPVLGVSFLDPLGSVPHLHGAVFPSTAAGIGEDGGGTRRMLLMAFSFTSFPFLALTRILSHSSPFLPPSLPKVISVRRLFCFGTTLSRHQGLFS